MKHELVVHCFGEWWEATVEDDEYEVITHNIEVLISPAITFTAKIVYDKTTKKFLKNETDTSSAQVEMEIWMMGNLPTLDINRNAFERQRKSYQRRKRFGI